ncbi:MAG: xanthine dehydrogenase family protein molybdopterin-binding subunit, partial [Acidobacteria bacterium]|nr:xanthine dehydrogenase family protein molybdopterin-binding subunit [Acidobacteriota bacterium]
MLVIGLSTAAVAKTNVLGSAVEPAAAAGAVAQGAGPYKDPDFRQLDSWIVIHEDNTASFFVGKTDGGQGTGTAFRQMMCDELDMPYNSSRLLMGDSFLSVDQGGSGGSDGIEVDGWPMRRTAAEARRVLLDLASARFALPVSALTVANAVISVTADPSKSVTYGELIGGKRFNVTLTGNNINATTGIAKVKSVNDFKIVGQSINRYDIPPKVDGSLTWAVDVKVPGMVHARNVRPPFFGAQLVSIDESSVNGLPGFLKVLSKGNYVAVVAEREEQAIKAAEQLKVTWAKTEGLVMPTSEQLYDFIRAAKPNSSTAPANTGDVDAAFTTAAKIVEAEYEVPFHGHQALGPAHGIADPRDGQMTIWSNDMKIYGHRNGVADFLGMPRDQVRAIWLEGPQLYGRTAADDAGFEAAWIAKELNRPVRMQWMRHEETTWDTKGPAYVFKMKGSLDEAGNVTGWHYDARACDYNHLGYNVPQTVLISQLQGNRLRNSAGVVTPAGGGSASPAEMYVIPNRRNTRHVVGLPLIWETPIRTANLRDPNGPQVTFAGESFIDELAFAAKADPVQFRLKLLTASTEDDAGFKRARSIATVKATAELYGWDSRPSPNPRAVNGDIATGRGISYCYRVQTVIVTIAEVEVNLNTGRVWVKRFTVGADCGLVINPEGLRNTIEGNTLHAMSRAMFEEFKWDAEKVTSVDWLTYLTGTHLDAPRKFDIVLVNGDPNPNRHDLPHYGAGEPPHKPTAAAIANAIFDATGVRIRRIPLTPERVLAALQTK